MKDTVRLRPKRWRLKKSAKAGPRHQDGRMSLDAHHAMLMEIWQPHVMSSPSTTTRSNDVDDIISPRFVARPTQ
eukprot:scaffold3120_cov219-Skeletonema_marinoi.AAC.8